MNIKIKGRTSLSNESSIPFNRIRDSIIDGLKQLGAQNLYNIKNEIKFKNDVWKLGLQTKMMSMVSAGKILIHQDDQIIIEYSYKVPINLPVFAIILFVVLGFLVNTLSFIGCFFVAFGVIINIISIKEKNRNFLSRIGKQIQNYSDKENYQPNDFSR
jgi:hypothetical protein